MAEQTVCNVNFYLNLRLFFGYYNEVTTKRARWIAKCYCLLVNSLVIAFLMTIILINNLRFFECIDMIKYLLYVVVSAIKKDEYLLRYYKKIPLIDEKSDRNTYNSLRICLKTTICLVSIFKFIGYLYFLYLYSLPVSVILVSVFNTLMWYADMVEWFHLLFVFGLLYCRVRNMRSMLESNRFDCSSRSEHHPRRYIQMYDMVMDRLQDTDDPVKLLNILHIFLMVPISLWKIKQFFNAVKIQTVIVLPFFNLIASVSMSYTPLILSAILADLTGEEIQEIMAIVVERRIDCDNERDRAEIQKLFEFMSSRPFNYNFWGVVPLNLRCLLTFLSFSITTVIAVLQVAGYSN